MIPRLKFIIVPWFQLAQSCSSMRDNRRYQMARVHRVQCDSNWREVAPEKPCGRSKFRMNLDYSVASTGFQFFIEWCYRWDRMWSDKIGRFLDGNIGWLRSREYSLRNCYTRCIIWTRRNLLYLITAHKIHAMWQSKNCAVPGHYS